MEQIRRTDARCAERQCSPDDGEALAAHLSRANPVDALADQCREPERGNEKIFFRISKESKRREGQDGRHRSVRTEREEQASDDESRAEAGAPIPSHAKHYDGGGCRA